MTVNEAAAFDDQWVQFLALVVWKLAPTGVVISAADIASFPAGATLVAHGHRDSFEFLIVNDASDRGEA